MIADILNCFPSFTYNFLMKEITFKQFILWHMHAMRITHKLEINLKENINPDDELEKINNKFKWDEKLKRWV